MAHRRWKHGTMAVTKLPARLDVKLYSVAVEVEAEPARPQLFNLPAYQNNFGLNRSCRFIQVRSAPKAIMTPIPAKETAICKDAPPES